MYLNQNSDCWVDAFLLFQCASWSLATVHSQSVNHSSGTTGLLSISHLLTCRTNPPCLPDVWEPVVWTSWRAQGGRDVPQWLEQYCSAVRVCPGVCTVLTRYRITSFLSKWWAYRWVWFSHSDSLPSSLNRHPQPLKHFLRSSDLQLPKTYPLLWNYQGELSE